MSLRATGYLLIAGVAPEQAVVYRLSRPASGSPFFQSEGGAFHL